MIIFLCMKALINHHTLSIYSGLKCCGMSPHRWNMIKHVRVFCSIFAVINSRSLTRLTCFFLLKLIRQKNTAGRVPEKQQGEHETRCFFKFFNLF